MPRVTCAFCRLPFSVRQVREGASYYCCSGCALASRIPMHGDQLPVSRELVLALVQGFGLFNQILFGALGAALVAEGRVPVGTRLMVVALVIGGLLLATSVTILWRARIRSVSDWLALLLAIVAASSGLWRGWSGAVPDAMWLLLAANAWLALWMTRGWVRRFVGQRARRNRTEQGSSDLTAKGR